MNNNLVDKLTTNSYKVLKLLFDNQVKMTDGSVFTPMTQIEIAEQIGVSKITMNALFKDLQEEGLVCPHGSRRGRYCLTDKALLVIEYIETLGHKLKGGA